MSALTGTPARLRDALDRMPLAPGEPRSRYIEHDRAADVLRLAGTLTRRPAVDVLHRLADEITRGGVR